MSVAFSRRNRWWWVAMGLLTAACLVVALDRPPVDGQSEERLHAIAVQIKCLQCAGESVAGSQASIAEDFREEIRRQMAQGRTDDEILTFFVRKYGQDVVLNPPATGFGAVVWVVPIVGLAAGLAGIGLVFARWRNERDEGRHASQADESLVRDALEQRRVGSE